MSIFNPIEQGFTAIPESEFDVAVKQIPGVQTKGLDNGILFFIAPPGKPLQLVGFWLQTSSGGQCYAKLAG